MFIESYILYMFLGFRQIIPVVFHLLLLNHQRMLLPHSLRWDLIEIRQGKHSSMPEMMLMRQQIFSLSLRHTKNETAIVTQGQNWMEG